MGNNVVTGHTLAAAGIVQGAPAFQRALEIVMRQHNIQPWDPKAMLVERLERQQELRKQSPFRYLNVKDGLAFFAAHAGGWVITLTRERFVELSLSFFRSRCMHISTEDAKLLYDVFDSIDLYGDAKLSAGELACGLSSFFAGDFSDHTEAVCQALSYSRNGRLTRAALRDLIQPYVYAMVPDAAELLRPMFTQYVTDELWIEISFHPDKSNLEMQELTKWVRYSTSGAKENMSVDKLDAPLYASAIADRSAATMKAALFVAYRAYQDKMQLMEYGEKTWQANHNGEAQRIRDVGVYRALAVSPASTSNLWSSLSTQASSGQEALQHFSLWPSRSRAASDASDVSDVSEASCVPCSPRTDPLPPPPPSLQSQPQPQPQPQLPCTTPTMQPQTQLPYTTPSMRCNAGRQAWVAQKPGAQQRMPTLLTCQRFDFRQR